MSNEVQRWKGGECDGCIESPEGEHVKYKDYERLAERNAKDRERLETFILKCRVLREHITDLRAQLGKNEK